MKQLQTKIRQKKGSHSHNKKINANKQEKWHNNKGAAAHTHTQTQMKFHEKNGDTSTQFQSHGIKSARTYTYACVLCNVWCIHVCVCVFNSFVVLLMFHWNATTFIHSALNRWQLFSNPAVPSFLYVKCWFYHPLFPIYFRFGFTTVLSNYGMVNFHFNASLKCSFMYATSQFNNTTLCAV